MKDLIERLRAGGVHTLLAQFTDIHGVAKGKLLPLGALDTVLGVGAGFVLVNDHDPKPLRYQFEAEHADDFTWDYLEQGPEVWRVRIGKPA